MISALKGQSGPILVGVVSWTFATLQKHQFDTRQAEVASIAEKIRVLYGPLRGNRLVYRSSYAAITQDEPLHQWLRKAEEMKNKEAIISWRKFHVSTLHPLDLEAVKLIKNNSHLIHKNCNPVEFEKFITRVSGNVYQMETWTNDMGRLEKADQMDENDFLMENNLIGFRCKRKNVTRLSSIFVRMLSRALIHSVIVGTVHYQAMSITY